jgi:uncharacterized protein with HEPN domain
MQRDARAYLQDILDACAAIESALTGLDFEAYRANRLVRSAVEREFIIVGEAAAALSHLDVGLFAKISHSQRIVDFRNQLTHEYPHVDDRIVWLIAADDVPMLRRECKDVLASIAGEG